MIRRRYTALLGFGRGLVEVIVHDLRIKRFAVQDLLHE